MKICLFNERGWMAQCNWWAQGYKAVQCRHRNIMYCLPAAVYRLLGARIRDPPFFPSSPGGFQAAPDLYLSTMHVGLCCGAYQLHAVCLFSFTARPCACVWPTWFPFQGSSPESSMGSLTVTIINGAIAAHYGETINGESLSDPRRRRTCQQ